MKFALAIALSLMCANRVLAEGSAPATPPQDQTKALNPNEVVCQKLEVVGSRLAVKKFCLTRSQWQDSRLQDRQFIEKIQASPCVIKPNGSC
jgi:hypothetical protein